jgi:exosortase
MTTATAAERAQWSRGTWAWFLPPWIAALALYAPLVPGLVHEWSEFPSLSHGFAIPFIAAYLVWARRDEIRARTLAPSAWGFPVLMAGLFVLTVGIRASEPFVARVSLPVTLLGLSLVLAGFAVTRYTWPGIVYLFFMIPLPWGTVKQVTYRSRLFDADASAMFLKWMGIPVYHDGVMLHLPNVNLEVADACSSIPAIAALLSLGVAYAVVAERPTWLRMTLILATLPLAIGANIIRITSVAALAYWVGLWTLHTSYHMFNGTVNFLFTFIFLMVLDAVLLGLTRRRRA